MPTFVLIHGGLCRGWVWDETAAALREDGHRVEVVDLPSSGTVVAIRRGDDTAAREYSPSCFPQCACSAADGEPEADRVSTREADVSRS